MNQLQQQISNPTLVRATTDLDLVSLYLGQQDDQGNARFSDRTLENYRRDIKRLLIFLEGHAMASMSLEDVNAFIQWLKNPPQEYIDPVRRLSINHAEWRPFYRTGLSPSALRQQLASIKALYRWMSDVGAISHNPFGLIKSAPLARSASTARHLYLEDLRAVTHYLDHFNEHDTADPRKHARQRWLWFAYLLSGLRISELLNHTTSHIYSELCAGEKVWLMAVAGKGRAHTEPHPLPDQFLEELWRYRTSLGLEPWPQADSPLVVSLSGKKAMTNRSTAHKTLKDLIHQIAQLQEMKENFDSAARLRAASTHWLRHSFVTCLLDTTTDIPAISSLARHRDLKTTMRYDHSEFGALKTVLNEFASSVC